MAERIQKYSLKWSVLGNKGMLYLKTADSEEKIPIDSADELFAIGEILRHYEEVFYDSTGQTIGISPKPPGT
jgi:hypothetical protein